MLFAVLIQDFSGGLSALQHLPLCEYLSLILESTLLLITLYDYPWPSPLSSKLRQVSSQNFILKTDQANFWLAPSSIFSSPRNIPSLSVCLSVCLFVCCLTFKKQLKPLFNHSSILLPVISHVVACSHCHKLHLSN